MILPSVVAFPWSLFVIMANEFLTRVKSFALRILVLFMHVLLRMRNFQGIVFIWTQSNKKNFKICTSVPLMPDDLV